MVAYSVPAACSIAAQLRSCLQTGGSGAIGSFPRFATGAFGPLARFSGDWGLESKYIPPSEYLGMDAIRRSKCSAAPGTIPNVLCVGDDPMLNGTRAAVLRSMGMNVQQTDSSHAARLLQRDRFDLVVVCWSVVESEVERLCHAVEHCVPAPSVLRVNGLAGPENAPTECYDAVDGTNPKSLIAQVTKLLEIQP
jgi:hypothetical protein